MKALLIIPALIIPLFLIIQTYGTRPRPDSPPTIQTKPNQTKPMKTMKQDKTARLTSALNAAGVRPYRYEACDLTYDAQRNLQGRTHYVNPDTLKGFQARILTAYSTPDGLLYVLVESVQSRPDHGGYTRRVVVFDVFGDIINERADHAETQGEWFRDTAKADASAAAFVAEFDAVRHTTAKLADISRRKIADARRTLAALAGKAQA